VPVELLLISADGLGTAGLWALSKFNRVFATALASHPVLPVTADGLYSSAAIWSEIVTGRRWYENGCPGYSRPGRSLNDCQTVSETALTFPVNLLAATDSKQDIAVNVPLLVPTESRIWLSDGITGGAQRVSPTELRQRPPFNKYKARPFQSIAEARNDITKALESSISSEINRLECALDLCEQTSIRLCIFRSNIFDLFGHLIGPDFYLMKHHQGWPLIERFLHIFEAHLEKLVACAEKLVLFSAYSQVACTATVNLNALLARAGYAALLSPNELLCQPDVQARYQAIAATRGNSAVSAPLLVRCHADRTTALSPVLGQIYLNRRERFQDGIVEDSRSESLLAQVKGSLKAHLQEQLDTPVSLDDLPAGDNAPDLKVFAPGVDFSSYTQKGIDQTNKPLSVHHPSGFAIFSQGKNRATASLSPTDLNAKIMELLR